MQAYQDFLSSYSNLADFAPKFGDRQIEGNRCFDGGKVVTKLVTKDRTQKWEIARCGPFFACTKNPGRMTVSNVSNQFTDTQ